MLKEHAKLQWERMENVECGDSSLTFEDVLPLECQTLPWQKAPKKVKKDVGEGLEVIAPSKL
jgi:hypothetical protein